MKTFFVAFVLLAIVYFQGCTDGFESTKRIKKYGAATGTSVGGTTGYTSGGTTGGGIVGTTTGDSNDIPPPPETQSFCPFGVSYFDYIAQRWRDLDMEAKQVEARDSGVRGEVTAVHARWLVTVIRELAAMGAPVGFEWYHNPVPDTNWYFSNDILMIRNELGVVCSVDVIAGRENWTQGDPAWIAYDVYVPPESWRDPFNPEFDGIGF